jgi:hypothetical protein
VISSLQAEEKKIIKDKSPDKKFALRLIHGEEGWETSIVELPSKKKIIDLEVVATSGNHERNGEGVAKDQVEAYKWRLLAARQGDEDAKHDTTILESKLKPEQIAEGQKRARDFMPR